VNQKNDKTKIEKYRVKVGASVLDMTTLFEYRYDSIGKMIYSSFTVNGSSKNVTEFRIVY